MYVHRMPHVYTYLFVDILNYHFMVHVAICMLWRAYCLHAANILLTLV